MPQLDQSLLINGLLLGGVVLLVWLGAWIIQRTRREVVDPSPESPEDILASFEEAYRRGEMSEDEIRRIRESMGGRPTKPKADEPRPPAVLPTATPAEESGTPPEPPSGPPAGP